MSINNEPTAPIVCPVCGLTLQSTADKCPRCGHVFAITPPAPPPPGYAPSSMPPAGHCPNCGLQLPRYQPLCPNCGAQITPVTHPGWPAAVGVETAPRLITGNKIVDVILGVLFALVTFALGGIGLAVVPITYLAVHRKYRAFAGGLGIGAGLAVVLILGALVACFSSLKNL